MTVIDLKLIESYTILVLAEKYILKEEDRKSLDQKIVPQKYITEVEIKVAERTIEVLGGVTDDFY